MGNIKQIIKNRTYYFFFWLDRNIDIYYSGYVTIKQKIVIIIAL